jgi:hypothetical protein
MAEYQFDPPLKLNGGIVIGTLDEAVGFVRGYRGARMPMLQKTVRQWLEDAKSPGQSKLAATAFAKWTEAEGLLSKLH